MDHTEIVDHAVMGMIVVVMMMRMRHVTMAVHVNNGIGEASRVGGKGDAESWRDGKEQSQRPQ